MILKYFNANQKKSLKKLEIILGKRNVNQFSLSAQVRKILADVKRNGDKAVIKYEKKFSKIRSKSNNIKFSNKEINKISKNVDKVLKKSIDLAYSRIKKFHSKNKHKKQIKNIQLILIYNPTPFKSIYTNNHFLNH